METTGPHHCDTCGRAIPADAPGGLCPGCVGAGLFADDDAGLLRGELEAADSIGGYRLLALAGEGGFGLVYWAQCGDSAAVALKVLKPGMDSAQVLARFEAERQALAQLDHPGIARVLDAGLTESGRPFFVMEWVEGETLDAWCRRTHPDMTAALRLFVKLCRALEHAHQRGIIHRDLKPGNVMVTPDGEPRVIDFGLARATDRLLTERSLWTRLDQLLGTPQYMSPEQAAGGAAGADTRTDVFGLGAVLYEMLTGMPPLDAAALRDSALEEVLRRIREEEPARPSLRAADSVSAADRRRLAGELDWIVLRALARERTRRYESVAGLRADVERFLRHEAVEARPPSRWYAARKFVRRHRAGVAAVASIAAALTVTAVVSTVSARRAAQAREETRRAFSQADAAAAAAHFSAERTGPGIAHLVRALRTDPENAEAARRLLMAMAEGPCAIPAAPPMLHSETVFHVEFVGDGSRVLTASTRDGVAKLWSWQPGAVALLREFHLPGMVSLSVSADGSLLAAGNLSGQVQMWRTADGTALWPQALAAAAGPLMVRGCVLSPDGTRLFTAAHDGSVRAFQLPGGSELWRQQRKPRAQNAALSRDGLTVAGCFDDGVVLICDAADGTVRGEARLPAKALEAQFLDDGRLFTAAAQQSGAFFRSDGTADGSPLSHGGRIYGAHAAADGRFAMLEGDDGRLTLWQDGRRLAMHAFPGPVYSGGLSPDGRFLAAGTREPDARLAVLRRDDGTLTGAPVSFPRSVHRLAWHPQGRWLAVAGRTLSAQIYDTAPQRPAEPHALLPLTHGAEVAAAWLLPDHAVAALSTDGSVWNWNGRDGSPAQKAHTLSAAVASQKVWQDCRYHAVALAAHAPAAAVLTTDGVLHFPHRDGVITVTPPAAPVALAISADGTLAAAAAEDGRVQTWRTADGIAVTSWQGPANPSALAVSADSIAAGTHAGMVVLHTRSGDQTAAAGLAPDAVLKLAFSPDGTRLHAGGIGHAALLLETPSGRLISEMRHLDASPPAGLRGTFTADSRRLLTWGSDDLRAMVWHVDMGTTQGRPLSWDYGPHLLALSRDQTLCAAWGEDHRLRLSSLHSRTESAPARSHPLRAAALAFSSDGSVLLTALTDGTLRLRPVPPLPDSPLPECFLTWCEAASGCTLRPDHSIAAPDFSVLEASRQAVRALPGGDKAARWMRWLVSDPAAREPAP